MSQGIRSGRRRELACRCLFAVTAVGLGCLSPAMLHAESPTVHGYITAVHPPDGFDVNGEPVITTAGTQFLPIDPKKRISSGSMRDAVQIGAWVQVFGERDRKAKTVTAQEVLFRDDRDRELTGLGVIEKVISTTPDLVFTADGYRVRVTPATEVKLPRDMKSTADVCAGLWVLYGGKLGQDGLLVAGKVQLLQAEHEKAKSEKAPGGSSKPAATPQPPANGGVAATDSVQPSHNASGQTEIKMDLRGKEIQIGNATYGISKDQALQSRVRRIGMSLVPDYQKRLPEGDPSKIQFLFIAVDDPMREVRTSSDAEGIILVPAQLAARFKNDDQLAAVLADGVAFNLEQQAPWVIQFNRAAFEKSAVMSAVSLVPYGGLVVDGAYIHDIHEQDLALKEQRGRVALELMAEAGYDPWQAPEAWRLAEPGKLPADTSKLRYPDRSGYQFAILNLMYRRPAPTNAAVTTSPVEGSASGKP